MTCTHAPNPVPNDPTDSRRRDASRRSRRVIAATAALGLALAACANDPIERGEAPTTTRYPFGPAHVTGTLVRATSCDELLDYLRANTVSELRQRIELMDEWSDSPVVGYSDEMAAAGAPDAMPSPTGNALPATDDASGSAERFDGAAADSGTNNQEAGVDEADLVKTDGRRVVSVRGDELLVVEIAGDGAATLTGRATLPGVDEASRLFLDGDRVMVLGEIWGGYPIPVDDVAFGTSSAAGVTGARDDGDTGDGDGSTGDRGPIDAVEPIDAGPIDSGPIPVVEPAMPEIEPEIEPEVTGEVDRPAPRLPMVVVGEFALGGGAPRLVASQSFEGSLVDARMIDGVVRVVVNTAPVLPVPDYPVPTGDAPGEWQEAERIWLEQQIEMTEQLDATAWLPRRADGSPAVDCGDVYLPDTWSGAQFTSVVTFPDGASQMTTTSVVSGSGGIVYASPTHLFVAMPQWSGGDVMPFAGAAVDIAIGVPGAASNTQIHSFELAGPAGADYVGSGTFEGGLLNRYSMSERDGVLRVALTRGGVENGESGIVTIRAAGGELRSIGEVWGLGPGESIRSVRWMGDTAYVVTFRQTDPFYVVDATDPGAPRVLGELKVPGFSSYLHPVGDALVLGVGSDATDEGMITGSKLSLYDVSDPAAPTELHTWVGRDLEFRAGWDPHAFSWDAEHSLVYLPYSPACFVGSACQGSPGGGVLVASVTNGRITEVARLSHEGGVPIDRAFPIRDLAVTRSLTGVGTHRIADWTAAGFARF